MTHTTAQDRNHIGQLLFGFFVPPLAWTAHLLISYPLVQVACATGNFIPLYIITILALVFIGGAGLVSYGVWRGTESETRNGNGATWTRRQFMGLAGVLLSIVFVLPILLSGFAEFVLSPCP